MPEDAFGVLAELTIETGDRWGDVAVDWQVADAMQVLAGERPFTYVTRPRGASKTSDAAGCALAWLLTAGPHSRGYWAASDRDQAALAIDTIRGFVERTPMLGDRVEVQTHRVIARASGASLETVPADAASSWGLRPSLLIADEFAWWANTPQPRQLWDSLSSAVAKSTTARLLVITSPSDPSHFSHEVLRHARGDALWEVRELTGLVPWLDPLRVDEQRRRLPEAMFRRLFLGEWAEGEEKLATAGDVDACVTHSGPLGYDASHHYVVGVDLGVKRDRTAVAVAHRDGDRVVVDLVAVWKGTRLRPVSLEAVEEFIGQASRSYGGAELIADPWQSIGMLERLRGQGVRASEFTFSQQSVGRLASTMVNLLRDRALGLPDDDELLDELRAVRLVERSPGSWRIDHLAGQHDDQVIAIAIAAQHLLREPQYAAPFAGPIIWDGGGRGGGRGGGIPLSRWQHEHVDEFDARRADHLRTRRALREVCPECLAETAARRAAAAAPPPAPTPERVGSFLITRDPNRPRRSQ